MTKEGRSWGGHCAGEMLSLFIQKVCSLTNTSSCDADILDTSTKPEQLCLLSSPPSNQPRRISLAPVLLKLAYLAMLFIRQLYHSASNVRQLKNK